MGGAPSDYRRGNMKIGAQKHTFDGFMGFTVYGGTVIALMLIFAILTVGGVGLAWLPALVITLVLGIVVGIGLKLNGAYFASITGLAIATAIVCAIVGLLAG